MTINCVRLLPSLYVPSSLIFFLVCNMDKVYIRVVNILMRNIVKRLVVTGLQTKPGFLEFPGLQTSPRLCQRTCERLRTAISSQTSATVAQIANFHRPRSHVHAARSARIRILLPSRGLRRRYMRSHRRPSCPFSASQPASIQRRAFTMEGLYSECFIAHPGRVAWAVPPTDLHNSGR